MTQINSKFTFSNVSQKSLEEMIVRLKTEITLREKYEQELEVSRRNAELATKHKSQFLANMSHEIRTPLGLILGFTEELLLSRAADPDKDHLISIIKKNSEVLARLINDILDISKIEAGKLEFNIDSILSYDFIKDIETNLQSKCQQKGICSHLDILSELPALFYSDEVRIKQILMNLISNSANHTDRGGIILKVSHCDETSFFYFDVIDTGNGISKEHHETIFEPFNQLHKNCRGNGLGLALSRELARQLGGDLYLIQSAPREGTWFRVKIKNQRNTHITMLPNNENRYKLEIPPDLSKFRILIVDDLQDNIKLLEAILKPTKARVASTTLASQANSKVREAEYDLVLLDLQMPDQSGFKTLRDLRDSGFKNQIWAVSADAMKNQIHLCTEAGFTEHIPKPINRTEFYKKLHLFKQLYKDECSH